MSRWRPAPPYVGAAGGLRPCQPVTPPGRALAPRTRTVARARSNSVADSLRPVAEPPVCSRTLRTPRSSPELDVTPCWPARPRRTVWSCAAPGARTFQQALPRTKRAPGAGMKASPSGNASHTVPWLPGGDVPSACADRDREPHGFATLHLVAICILVRSHDRRPGCRRPGRSRRGRCRRRRCRRSRSRRSRCGRGGCRRSRSRRGRCVAEQAPCS